MLDGYRGPSKITEWNIKEVQDSAARTQLRLGGSEKKPVMNVQIKGPNTWEFSANWPPPTENEAWKKNKSADASINSDVQSSKNNKQRDLIELRRNLCFFLF